VSDTRLTYRFGPLERRGLVGPLSLLQVGTVAVALVAAVLLLDLAPNAGGALLGLTLVLISGAMATVPLGGRTPVQWLPLFSAYVMRGLSGRRRFRSPAPRIGMWSGSRAPDQGKALPRDLRGVELLTLPYRSGTIGAVSDQGGRTVTAVLACEVASFQLLDPPAQERRLAQWGIVLSACAGTPLRRLQWVERTAPAQGDELARWLHSERDPVLGERGSPLMESYLELIESSAPVIHSHELLLAVQLDRNRVRGPAGAAQTALVEQTERIARALEAAEVKVLGALSASQLASTLRTGFDPYARDELTRGDLAAERADSDGEDRHRRGRRTRLDAGAPLASNEEWDHLRADGAFHATYWIAGWPRVDVAPMFMSALLNPSGVVRTVAVSFEPLAPERSTREVEAAITRDRADRELRQRFGQGETARQRQAHEAALRREAELAAGHGEVRFSGFITVSGRDGDELRRACQETLQHAAVARLELRRMYGQQAEAFTFTLPLARGLT
jgi:hypothetical protein